MLTIQFLAVALHRLVVGVALGVEADPALLLLDSGLPGRRDRQPLVGPLLEVGVEAHPDAVKDVEHDEQERFRPVRFFGVRKTRNIFQKIGLILFVLNFDYMCEV